MFPMKRALKKKKKMVGRKKGIPKKTFPMSIGKKVMAQQNSQYFAK